jgi:crotonobetainyl-CoA:carnitine CoA-transferase CaiB-like acyl-CoA transferase
VTSPLEPYRVIDLTNEDGLLCGQLLADLGADVIQVEPPGGSSARGVGPWWKDERGPERSLFWWSYARNKRSVVLDVGHEPDRERLRELAAGADFFIESETPGRLASLGLGYADLAARNPGLVYVSISPFGQQGPKAHWAATDLTVMAASGHAWLSGDKDRPPVRVRVPQAHAHAAADAAVGALIAHAERRRSGRGQHVDVSAQQSATLATMFRSLDAPLEQTPAQRISGGVQVGPAFLKSRYPLVDGWVVLGPGFLPSTGHFMRRLLTWALEKDFGERALLDEDWGSFGIRMILGQLPPDAYEPVDGTLSALFASVTKAEVMQAAVERRLLIAPMLGMDEIADSEHLAARDFPVSLEHPEAGTVWHPGAWARFGASPWQSGAVAPRLDEHGDAIRREAPRHPVFSGASTGGPSAPLDGVRILDLFWVLAGPGATRMLADYGATVVHVESSDHLDTLRAIPPYHYSNPHAECSGGFQSANANKLGLCLDLASEQGREIVLELVRWADVVTESFAPGVMDRYGLGYEALRAVKPDLVMISSCLMGQTGPWRTLTGFGNLAATVTGFQQLAGWPGNPPSGPYGAYTDFIAVRYNALAILAALEHRARTGEGQYIDQSQAESALHFLAPAFLDYTVNGRVQGAAGNDDPDLFPHAMFPALGDDRWVAIAVRSEADWAALCDAMERPDLLARRDECEAVQQAIADWTRTREASAIETALQARGVPVHEALDTPRLFADPQLQARGHYVEIGHSIFPTTTVESSRLCLSRSPARRPEQALSLGRDNRLVLEELLGYAPERVEQLLASGALG